MPRSSFCRKIADISTLILVTLLCNACGSLIKPYTVTSAHPGIQGSSNAALRDLPAPKDKVVAAVYRFRDQTGQYKPSETAASFSTAVTQGATSILVRALDESGWFIPIEREGLSNLLNERQIIQSTRAVHTTPEGEQLGSLPPLLYAGVLLEGGIIGYDTNVMTGGAGARYFGIGGSGEYRRHQVTIYLRAVSTQSGRVLQTVHATKSILSQKVDGGAFLFVDQDRLLEAEAGYSYNEPAVLAVTEAIEVAVRSLILEGVQDGLWDLAVEADTLHQAFLAYDTELDAARRRDYFDRVRHASARPGWSIGLTAGGQRYAGDYSDPRTRSAFALQVLQQTTPKFRLGIGAVAGRNAAADAFDDLAGSLEFNLRYLVLPEANVLPYIEVGTGATFRDLEHLPSRHDFGDDLIPHLSLRSGFEWLLTRRLGFESSFGMRYALYDELDGATAGRYPDSMWDLRLGFVLYTGLFNHQ